jgi:hypothetical protein
MISFAVIDLYLYWMNIDPSKVRTQNRKEYICNMYVICWSTS